MEAHIVAHLVAYCGAASAMTKAQNPAKEFSGTARAIRWYQKIQPNKKVILKTIQDYAKRRVHDCSMVISNPKYFIKQSIQHQTLSPTAPCQGKDSPYRGNGTDGRL